MRLRSLLALALLAMMGGLLLAGCSDDEDGADAGTTAATATTTTAPEPLPIEERLDDDGIAGLSPHGAPTVAATPLDFARAVDEDDPQGEAADLRRAGFRQGAVQLYGDGRMRFGLSAAIEYGTPAQAMSELDRIYAEFDEDNPPSAERGSLPTIPGSRTVSARGTEGGQSFAFSFVFFTDGPFLYGLGVGGAEDTVVADEVPETANVLYDRVRDRPSP